MNWLPRASLYSEQAAKRAKQKAAHEEFMTTQSGLSTTIGSIMSNNITETGNIVSRVAAERLGIKLKS